MKLIAFYLPQFHRVPENDEWWGEGFTEWTAVKQAEVYFDGQVQPREPLDDNYYDLMDKHTFEWQAELMHKYDVYGLSFYHYWFKDGRMILEKPAENLLEWKDIDMPFCFTWANETWARSWSKISEKNAWSYKIDESLEQREHNGKDILLEQQYGTEKDWIQHFEYLAKFFKDDRYIKVDNRPMLMIYLPNSIPCLSQMVACWRQLAPKYGFDDIYLLGTNQNVDNIFDAVVRREPNYSSGKCKARRSGMVDSAKIWNNMLSRECDIREKAYLCGFPGYDDTPRRGKYGKAFSLVTPAEFEEYMTKLIAKSYALGNEYTFINAWNEWGEGMYLEPDKMNGYGMLEAVANAQKRAKNEPFQITYAAGESQDSEKDKRISRYLTYWQTFDKWLSVLEDNKSIAEYLGKKGYRHIALYGVGMFAEHLIKQLENTDIVIDYGIDERGVSEKKNFEVYSLSDELPDTQLIIVTVMYEYKEIRNDLLQKVSCEIMSIGELIEALNI